MIALIISGIALIATFITARRSLVYGLLCLFVCGYGYGIVRANVPGGFSHFIFDAAVIGLYAALLGKPLSMEERIRIAPLRPWFLLLLLWPAILLVVPVNDPLIQVVGFRGNIFLLPFLILGARLNRKDIVNLAKGLAALNIVALGFGVCEFIWGVAPFFPFSPVTEILYRSRDVGNEAFRIPATFATAHVYGAAMVLTLPFLVPVALSQTTEAWQRLLLAIAIAAAIIGVFMAGARTPVVMLVGVLVVVATGTRWRLVPRFSWVLMLFAVGWIVSSQERFQRFTTLKDTDLIETRVRGSMNENFLMLIADYPLGRGLGAGGTSIPYFLQDRIKEPMLLENEFARILLEQGIPGLVMWTCFLAWLIVRGWRLSQADLGKRIAWVLAVGFFATGFIGIGLMTSIPGTCLLFLSAGWMVAGKEVRVEAPALARALRLHLLLRYAYSDSPSR